ncbi:hypothetical protein M2337_001935 [Sphingobium sp. B2D3A]|uniref:hypothetical protein n=1 Tax=Sphingobium TaxID=165695 RepID=UPI0015EB5A99|nr:MULTISPECIES: hypothetical protein [Sphingobium]MCW2337702.1 hypothetical protein [Sphingobium sp. B2D3A]MCW2350667.1 hypothetical protein [Sphingobium sp. B12D2B]MCW2362083.1 hypothetical protein [Sphingobium sp. B10D3B]MCW2366123.1 hypothetical protein [Sphingobium sp. B7D2B]MCW2369769.1 hypothetical protein [Sphingobium sp. B11D3D]
MNLSIIENFAAATGSLRVAMQSADPQAIETAMDLFRISLDAIKSIETWERDPAIKARFSDLIEELDSSRMLACLLGDMTTQMHGAIADRDLDVPQPLYQRAG